MQQEQGLKALYLELEKFCLLNNASPAIMFASVEEMPKHFQGRTLVFERIKGMGRSDGKEFFGILISEHGEDNKHEPLYRIFQEEGEESSEVTVDTVGGVETPPAADLDLMLGALYSFLDGHEDVQPVTPTNNDIQVLH